MAVPPVATGNRETALLATVPTSPVVATVRTSPVVGIGYTSPVVATVRTSRAAAIGRSSQVVVTDRSRPVPDSTDRLTRGRCPSGSIHAV